MGPGEREKRACLGCGAVFTAKNPIAKYCLRCRSERSKPGRTRRKPSPRTCRICGAIFFTYAANACYCSDPCREKGLLRVKAIYAARQAEITQARAEGRPVQTYHQTEDDGCYLPTEDEIAAACVEIQAGWSEPDRERRRSVAERRAEVLCYHVRATNKGLVATEAVL